MLFGSAPSSFRPEIGRTPIEQTPPAPTNPILLVEDNPGDVFIIKEVLRECRLDLAVHVARDGHEAMLYLNTSAAEDADCPALVTLDLNLPKITGFEVLSHLRKSSCRNTPVIIVTSSNARVDREITERLGVQGYFQKPSNLQQYMNLCAVIRAVIAPRGSRS